MNNLHSKFSPRRFLPVILAIIFLSTITGCYTFFFDGREIESNSEYRYYSFDSNTILDLISKGNVNVFTLLHTVPDKNVDPLLGLVSWNQADFYRVAKLIQQEAWQESLGSQSLYKSLFTMRCNDIDKGNFSMGQFMSSERVTTKEEEKRVEYYIRITPSNNLIRTTRVEYSPAIYTKEPVDLGNYKITAEDALRIAEENGGASKRLEYDNDCIIDVSTTGVDDGKWLVLYQINDGDRWILVLKLSINSETGVVNSLTPN